MINRIVLIILAAVLVSSPLAASETTLNLIDLSGSIPGNSVIFDQNMALLNRSINTKRFGPKDRFIILGFKSEGIPYTITDFTFPKRRGGGNINIRKALGNMVGQINQGFQIPKVVFNTMGSGTDVIGSVKQGLMFLADSPANDGMHLNIFSDGLQSTGIGVNLYRLHTVYPYSQRVKKMTNYLDALEAMLSEIHLTQHGQQKSIVWYGGIYPEDLGLKSNDLSYLEARLKAVWTKFLERELPNTRVTYILKYET